MNDKKEFMNSEKEKYGELQASILFAMNDIRPFLPGGEYEQRGFVKRIPSLTAYLEKVNKTEYDASNRHFFDMFKSKDKYVDDILVYKRGISEEISKLEQCRSCECLTCVQVCPFKSCKACGVGIHVSHCDKERYYVTKGYQDIKLYSNDEERNVSFRVIGLLVDRDTSKNYMYLSEKGNENNQHILLYEKKMNGTEEFQPLATSEEVDTIYEKFLAFNAM